MTLEIEVAEVDGVTIFELKGRLVLGEPLSLLQDRLNVFAQTENPRALLDLKHVPFIDSSGLGVLVSAYSSCKKNDGALKLVHAEGHNIELLVLTKLNTVFEIFTDRDTAIDSFFPDRKRRTFDILQFVQKTQPPSDS